MQNTSSDSLINNRIQDYIMPRSQLTKNDILHKVYQMKTDLYSDAHKDKTGQWHDGAHHFLNQVLDAVNEYRC